nr:replication-associated protein [Tick-associated circular DNA virus]
MICNHVGRNTGIYSWGVPCVLGYNISLPRTPVEHMPPFSINCRYVLLTYAQSGDLSEWSVLDHISSLGAECIIAREDHADGGTHLHVFCDFGRKFRSRQQNLFDVDGRHANIQPSRGRAEFGYDYAVKDGNVVAGGLARPGSGGLPKAKNIWSEIVGAESRDEFLDLVQCLDPKSFVLRHRELLEYADRYYAERIEPYVGPTGVEFELGMVPELARWRGESFGDDPVEGMFRGKPQTPEYILCLGCLGRSVAFRTGFPPGSPKVTACKCHPRARCVYMLTKQGRSRSLVLYGPSRLGKTLWARSLGPHIYIMGIMSGAVILRDAPDAEYAVFDDMRGGIAMFPSFKEWLGGQSVVSVKKLYRDPVQMPWGKPCIWLANSDPRDQLKADITDRTAKGRIDLIYEDIAWLEANCIFVELTEAIFRASIE